MTVFLIGRTVNAAGDSEKDRMDSPSPHPTRKLTLFGTRSVGRLRAASLCAG